MMTGLQMRDLIPESQIILFLVEVIFSGLMFYHLALKETLEVPLVKLQEISQEKFHIFIQFYIIQMQIAGVMEEKNCIHRSCCLISSVYLEKNISAFDILVLWQSSNS